MEVLKVKILNDTASVPSRGSKSSAGMDLSCDKAFVLQPNERRLISTGLAVTLPVGTWGEIKPRSGLAVSHGIDVMAGVIDQDYIGEIKVLLVNTGNRPLKCQAGERIAQMVIQPYAAPNIMVVPQLVETHRGEGGFGSTGL